VRPPAWRLLLAYAAIYFIWGSTYLAIKWAVETIPPALAMGGRSVVGGACMLALAVALRDESSRHCAWCVKRSTPTPRALQHRRRFSDPCRR